MTYQFSCRATEIEVRDLMRRLVDVLREEKVGEDVQSSVTIAVTEGLNNIVEHALIARPQEIIDLALSVDAVQVFVLLQDGGDAMPGCQAPVGHPADLFCRAHGFTRGWVRLDNDPGVGRSHRLQQVKRY